MHVGFRGRWENPEAASAGAALPREILDRVDRVLDYHKASKLSYEQVHQHPHALDWINRPSPFRILRGLPRVALPTTVLDIPVPSLNILADGVTSLPESQLHPPQDLKTLASWLFFANGVVAEKKFGQIKYWLRSVPSVGSLFPYELYVAAFGIEGLEPGLYHYCPQGFFLERMRDGPTTLSLMKRGRPDLDFLKNVPAAMLVSTIFSRSSWGFRQRAYRYVLHDAGALVQNLVATANGLGMATNTRLRLNERNMHELLGLSPETTYAEAEAVQGMVVWADDARKPLAAKPTPPTELGVIPREPLAQHCASYGSILAVHADCTAPGVAIRDIRPPLTELSPLPRNFPRAELPAPPPPDGGRPMRHVLRNRKNTADFARIGVPRASLWTINRTAFRSGGHSPIYPSGPHVGLVRPFWIVNEVAGMNMGLWHYDPMTDRWAILRHGDMRREAAYLSMEQPAWGNGAAICFLTANLAPLMQAAGPDLYRLANLEAGLVAQRIQLAAAAVGLGSCALGAFYDDEVRTFLDLQGPGWEPLHEVVIGVTPDDAAAVQRQAEEITLSFR